MSPRIVFSCKCQYSSFMPSKCNFWERAAHFRAAIMPSQMCSPTWWCPLDLWIMWTSAHINILWTSFRALWDSRNGKVHGVDTSTRREARREKIHQELRALYAFWTNMRYRGQDIFHPTVEAHIKAQPVWAIHNWLKIHVPIAKHSAKEAAWSAVRHVQTIASYFWTQNHVT
jgi:hypothetical protein